MRLVDGCDMTEGRVEVCLHGQWGTVCDDRWTNINSEVVCRQLGLPTSGKCFSPSAKGLEVGGAVEE